MRTIRTNFDRQELRRDRRYAVPPLTVRLGAAEFISTNWSLGGFLLAGEMTIEIGAKVAGSLSIDGRTSYEFAAELVRRDGELGTWGFHFLELSPAALSALDRALARRLAGGRK